MAEDHFEKDHNGCVGVTALQGEVEVTTKRCSSTSPDSAPLHKSPRIENQYPTIQTSNGEELSETDQRELKPDDTDESSDHAANPATRKSLRRATMTRRSVPALSSQHQLLCRSISTSLPQQERLQKLMEVSMKLAVERAGNLLQSVPKASLESFNKQVERMQKEWECLAKTISSDPNCDASRCSDPLVQKAMENLRKAIKRVQTESEAWETLLEKHCNRAQELERKVEQGLQTGVPLDPTSVAQSSQYHFIQRKPDYHSLLRRQQPLLSTISMIMETQSKMVRQLAFIKEQSQLLIKETSGRLAEEAGLQDLSPDIIKKLMGVPLSSKTA